MNFKSNYYSMNFKNCDGIGHTNLLTYKIRIGNQFIKNYLILENEENLED